MKELIEQALAARAKAYAPYSKYKVGAALRDERGLIYGGCNVENAAYPQGWCAEASAISALIMAGGQTIMEVAIVGTGINLCTPCGGCRQKLREFAKGDVRVHCLDENGNLLQSFTLEQLLPASFGPENLT